MREPGYEARFCCAVSCERMNTFNFIHTFFKPSVFSSDQGNIEAVTEAELLDCSSSFVLALGTLTADVSISVSACLRYMHITYSLSKSLYNVRRGVRLRGEA